MEELVGEHGYDSTTVPLVIKAARVSTATFYRFFSDKVDCFIALCEERGERLLAELTPDEEKQCTFSAGERLDRGVEAYLRWWQKRPALARAYFVELPTAGPRAIAERERQYARFEALNRIVAASNRESVADAPEPPEVDVRASVLVTAELIAFEIRRGNVERLTELRDDVCRLLLKLLGPGAIELER